jgi:caffeoyl-CoA O-methyltransferase
MDHLDAALIAYAEAHTTPEPAVLARLDRETHLTQVYPQMLSGHLQGTLLRMIVQMLKPQRILEIGTFTGYSALAMGLGLDPAPNPGLSGWDAPTPGPSPRGGGGVLHTIEANPELEDGIRKYIREAGLEDRVVVHIGQALDVIPALEETWDLVFIDADKPNYLNYFEMVLPRLRPGGFILADNVLWDGKVLEDPDRMDRDTLGIHQFNEYIRQDEQVEHLLLPLRDGLMLIRKIG